MDGARAAEETQRLINTMSNNECSSLIGQHMLNAASSSHLNSGLGVRQVPQQRQGFDIIRLSYPPIDEINEDFICGLCQKIVNDPMECKNGDCAQLYCSSCCIVDE